MSNPQNMRPKEIRILLLKADITQAELAREQEVKQQLIYHVIEGNIVSDRIRQHIAKRLGIDIKRIWPDPYLYYGGPRKAGRPVSESRSRAV
jgi:lambda repressor-like predicted transcriptional regulator